MQRANSIALSLVALSMGCVGTPSPQLNRSTERVPVPKELILFDDGDSLNIDWKTGPESVRILGIDTPEVLHLDHGIPYPQPFGDVAAGFLRGCIAATDTVELLRSGQKDPFGRTLGYLFLDGKNYSVLAISARLAVESVTRYGDNGLEEQAQACLSAARDAGPVPFEDPHAYRRRMKEITNWTKARKRRPPGK